MAEYPRKEVAAIFREALGKQRRQPADRVQRAIDALADVLAHEDVEPGDRVALEDARAALEHHRGVTGSKPDGGDVR